MGTPIPNGRIAIQERATSRLFGLTVLMARVAETESVEVLGYVGVYSDPKAAHTSILVKAGFRRRGRARQLVEDTFKRLPEGLEVEAWVGVFNKASLAVMSRLGFDLARVIEDRGRPVHVFTRVS